MNDSFVAFVASVRSRARRPEIGVLLLVLVVALAVWGFVAIADEVVEGDTHAADEAIVLAMRTPGDLADPVGPGWVEEIGRDLTALGGIGILGLITAAVFFYLLIDEKPRAAWFLLVAVATGLLLSNGLKAGFDRPRPDLVPHGSIVYTTSFPSGHSMLSAVTYLTMGSLLARVHGRRRVKIYLLAVAVLLTVLVGVSRVYLGVHWPTDVLAGWTAGAAWATLCWLVAHWLQRRGEVEEDPEEAAAPEG